MDVLARIAAGDSNKLIARALDLSPHTVKRHVANLLDKLGLASRGQAAAWYRQPPRAPAPGAPATVGRRPWTSPPSSSSA
jgi:DNA-binding IclR family transcriptional regulator